MYTSSVALTASLISLVVTSASPEKNIHTYKYGENAKSNKTKQSTANEYATLLLYVLGLYVHVFV